MLRYELGSKFWEIALEVKQYTIRFGKIDSVGQTQVKKFGGPNAARSEYNKAVKKKVREGYELVKRPVQPARAGNTQLEQAIETNPYDADAYSVYADYL